MPMKQLESDRHHELAAFLRSRRAHVSPEQVDYREGHEGGPWVYGGEKWHSLPESARSGIPWLEQGRDIHVSAHVLERLDANERVHVFLLALRQPLPSRRFHHRRSARLFHQLLTQLGTIPACVVDARLNVVAWNAAYRVVFGDIATRTAQERNLIWQVFTSPVPQANEEWKTLARVYLAQIRATYGRFINDPWWATQIAELSRISPEFRELWAPS